MALKISESAAVQMPMKTVASLIVLVDQEQLMLLEDLYKTTEKIEKRIEDMMHNKVNIQFLQKQMEKALADIEVLKDKVRANGKNH